VEFELNGSMYQKYLEHLRRYAINNTLSRPIFIRRFLLSSESSLYCIALWMTCWDGDAGFSSSDRQTIFKPSLFSFVSFFHTVPTILDKNISQSGRLVLSLEEIRAYTIIPSSRLTKKVWGSFSAFLNLGFSSLLSTT